MSDPVANLRRVAQPIGAIGVGAFGTAEPKPTLRAPAWSVRFSAAIMARWPLADFPSPTSPAYNAGARLSALFWAPGSRGSVPDDANRAPALDVDVAAKFHQRSAGVPSA